MAGHDPDEWTFEQRATVAEDMDRQLVEVIDRVVRLSRELLAETSIADYLVSRKARLRLDEDELPF